MFERLFQCPRALARQKDGPLAAGTSSVPRPLCRAAESPRDSAEIAIYILIIAKALRLADRPGERISRAEIEAAADRVVQTPTQASRTAEYPRLRLRFIRVATRWLMFPGAATTAGHDAAPLRRPGRPVRRVHAQGPRPIVLYRRGPLPEDP